MSTSIPRAIITVFAIYEGWIIISIANAKRLRIADYWMLTTRHDRCECHAGVEQKRYFWSSDAEEPGELLAGPVSCVERLAPREHRVVPEPRGPAQRTRVRRNDPLGLTRRARRIRGKARTPTAAPTAASARARGPAATRSSGGPDAI